MPSERTPFQRLKATSCPSVGQWRGCGPPSQPEAPGGLLDAIWSARSSVTMKNKTKSVRRKKKHGAFETRKHVEAAVITASQSSLAEETSARPLMFPVSRYESSVPSARTSHGRLEKKNASTQQQKKSMSVEFSDMVITYKRHSGIVVLRLIAHQLSQKPVTSEVTSSTNKNPALDKTPSQ